MREKPRSTCVLLPLASSDSLKGSTAQWIYHDLDVAFAEAGVPYHVQRSVGLDQAQARAELLSWYYETARSEFEDALFIDGDMAASPELVTGVLARLEEPLLGVPYEMREHAGDGISPSDWTVDTFGRDAPSCVREGARMMRVRGMGLGCVRLRREAVERLYEEFKPQAGADHVWSPTSSGRGIATPSWTSHIPGTYGLPVLGLFEPIVEPHPEGSTLLRRRPEDMSFFARCELAGLSLYALLDAPIFHDGRGGRSFADALQEAERRKAAALAHLRVHLCDVPDALFGLRDVLDGAYDVPGLEFDRPPHILDVGANVGAFAHWAAARWPGARIQCFEPEPENFRRLERNTGELGEVTAVFRAAVVAVDRKGEPVDLHLAPRPGEHTTVADLSQGGPSIKVPSLFVGELPPCDVLKLDCEGGEAALLERYPHLASCRAVLLEWHTVADYHAIRAMMAAAGFACLVDRARGNRTAAARELCFVRKAARGAMREAAE